LKKNMMKINLRCLSPVSPVVSQYHRAAKRSELNRQQRRCQPGGNRRPIAVLHAMQEGFPIHSPAVGSRISSTTFLAAVMIAMHGAVPGLAQPISSQERSAPTFVLLTPKEAATRLKVSQSFLAKARMRGDGPPYIMIGRSIRYSEATLIQWMRSQQRLSTSE